MHLDQFGDCIRYQSFRMWNIAITKCYGFVYNRSEEGETLQHHQFMSDGQPLSWHKYAQTERTMPFEGPRLVLAMETLGHARAPSGTGLQTGLYQQAIMKGERHFLGRNTLHMPPMAAVAASSSPLGILLRSGPRISLRARRLVTADAIDKPSISGMLSPPRFNLATRNHCGWTCSICRRVEAHCVGCVVPSASIGRGVNMGSAAC
jgi:hypothetical protein